FNTVFDAQPLLHQFLALAVRTLGILFVRCRHAHHAAGLVITPEIGRKHAQHALRIEPVRFGPSGAAVDENAGGFKNMAGDTMCRQQTVQPEAVTSRLKAADDAYLRRVEPASNTGPQRRDQSQQGGRVAAIDSMQMWLLRPWHAGGDEPRCCTEFDSKEDGRINVYPAMAPGRLCQWQSGKVWHWPDAIVGPSHRLHDRRLDEPR